MIDKSAVAVNAIYKVLRGADESIRLKNALDVLHTATKNG